MTSSSPKIVSASVRCFRRVCRPWRRLLITLLIFEMVLLPNTLLMPMRGVEASGPTSPAPPDDPRPGGDPDCPEDDPDCTTCGDDGSGGGGGASGGAADNDDDDDGDGEPDDEDPIEDCHPVYLRYGSASEEVADLFLPTPAFDWGLSRSYSSGINGNTGNGNKWLSGVADMYLLQQGTDVALLINANSKAVFTGAGTPVAYTAPGDTSFELEHDATAKEFVLTNRRTKEYITFFDFTVTPTAKRGKLKEESTLQWNFQNKTGFQYSYNVITGALTQITSPEGQDYNIVITRSGTRITKVEIKDGTTVLQRVEYTYYEDVATPSADLGSSGDLVQVKVSRRATKDTGTTLSIVRYTQYRYNTGSQLKAVYAHDAIQRIIASLDVTDETNLLTKADLFGTPDVEQFANRRFTYYAGNAATSSINTPFATGENLNSTYGGSEAAEAGYVKTETVLTGCGACSTTGGITKSYFYMDLAQGATLDQNEVVRLVVVDTEDTDGNTDSRSIYGLNDGGRRLRKVFIDDPTGTPTYWCQSWKLATSGKEHRLGEYRLPSAHNVTTAANLRNYLDPYDSETSSWTNDTNTLNASDGAIYVLAYNEAGMRTDTKVKEGKNGTAYFVRAVDYGDADGDAAGNDTAYSTRVVARYDFPTQTTTKTDGKKTSYSFTFWDTDDRLAKTKTTTLPAIATSQNGSGTATTVVRYYDKSGRVRWREDGEGYVKYYAHNPVTGGRAYEATDINPGSVSTDVSTGSTGNWEAWTVGGPTAISRPGAAACPPPSIWSKRPTTTPRDTRGSWSRRAVPSTSPPTKTVARSSSPTGTAPPARPCCRSASPSS